MAYTTCDSSVGLIVGGVNADPDQFPHQSAIGYPDLNGDLSFKCGGSLISERFVLTAAHCEKADRTSPTVVRLGDLDLSKREKNLPEIDVQIDKFISHEAYNKDTNENDIAVIKMQTPAPFSKSIRPACLHQTEAIAKPKAVATGWGEQSLRISLGQFNANFNISRLHRSWRPDVRHLTKSCIGHNSQPAV